MFNTYFNHGVLEHMFHNLKNQSDTLLYLNSRAMINDVFSMTIICCDNLCFTAESF